MPNSPMKSAKQVVSTQNEDSRDQSIASGTLICKTACLNADRVLSLLALNRRDHLCINLTGLCTLAVLTTLIVNRYEERQSAAVA